MSRPAFTAAQKKLKNEILQKFNLEGAAPVLAEISQLKSRFAAELATAIQTASTSTGDAKRAATIAAKQAKKAGQAVVVAEKTIYTLTKPEDVRAAQRAERAAKKAAKLAAVVVETAPETVAVAPVVESAPVAVVA